MLTAIGSCPMWVSTGSHAHWLLHGSDYGKFVKKIRERREGGSGQGLEHPDSLPVWLPSGWLCPWQWQFPSRCPFHTNLSRVLQSPFGSRESWCSTTSEVSLHLWFPCTFVKMPFSQHPPTCPNMRVPLKTLLIIKHQLKDVLNIISRQWKTVKTQKL